MNTLDLTADDTLFLWACGIRVGLELSAPFASEMNAVPDSTGCSNDPEAAE
jgi:hypothetical protein